MCGRQGLEHVWHAIYARKKVHGLRFFFLVTRPTSKKKKWGATTACADGATHGAVRCRV